MHRDRHHVLVVDDEEVVRNGLSKSECFPRLGYRVVGTAADGREALALTRSMKPDLVVTDINMPVMDGLSYLQALREKGDDTAVLILSCYDDFHFAQRAIHLEVASYLLKPFTDGELTEALERVKRLLEERRRERHTQETENFLLQGRDSVLLSLLHQTVIRGGRPEIVHNIHHFGLMERYSFYGMVFLRGLRSEGLVALRALLATCPMPAHLLETVDQGCLVLLCSTHVSNGCFAEELRRLADEWRQALAPSVGAVACSSVFSSMELAHDQFLLLLSGTKQQEEALNQGKEEPGAAGRKEIQSALAFIEEHLCEESLCLNRVAESVYISPFYFSRLFTREMGMSFVRYVNARRVERACLLLHENKLRIYEISKAIGFQNETYFHQVFKGIKGVTPKKYQREGIGRQ